MSDAIFPRLMFYSFLFEALFFRPDDHLTIIVYKSMFHKIRQLLLPNFNVILNTPFSSSWYYSYDPPSSNFTCKLQKFVTIIFLLK